MSLSCCAHGRQSRLQAYERGLKTLRPLLASDEGGLRFFHRRPVALFSLRRNLPSVDVQICENGCGFGTILVAINVGPAIMAGELSYAALWRVPLNYVVPFCVATWGALGNVRSNRPR